MRIKFVFDSMCLFQTSLLNIDYLAVDIFYTKKSISMIPNEE